MNVLEQAIKTFGIDNQLTVAIEEFAELTKEICKHKRGSENTNSIIEEMADCYIMLEQMQMIFSIDEEELVDAMDKKIKRLIIRLNDHPTEKGGGADA